MVQKLILVFGKPDSHPLEFGHRPDHFYLGSLFFKGHQCISLYANSIIGQLIKVVGIHNCKYYTVKTELSCGLGSAFNGAKEIIEED